MSKNTNSKKITSYIFLLILSIFTASFSIAQTISLKGKLKNATDYTVVLFNPNGSSQTQKLTSNGNFTFAKLKLSSIKGSSLQLVAPDGRFYGPVVLGKKSKKVSIAFSGKQKSKSSSLNLGNISLKSGYAILPTSFDSKAYNTPNVSSDNSGKPTGAGRNGIVSASIRETKFGNFISSQTISVKASASSGGDSDRDGIVDALDADSDGDGILNSADPSSEGTDVPYVFMGFDFRKTLNANVRDGLSASVIDAVVSGENVFASTFYISLPDTSSVDGAHLICGDSLTYCRPNSPLGYSSGVSESSESFRGPMSSLLNSSGYPVLERISNSGRPALVLSIQPRVGRDIFRPGDMYRVVLTTSGSETTSKTFSLPPFFVSVPAIRDYTANRVTTNVDYSSVTPTSGSIPGTSSSDPIILGSDGLITLNFWRPQREAIGDEVGYQDFGGLNYGVTIGNSTQAACAGLFTNVSSDLVEDSTATGTGGSFLANQGADLDPLEDQRTDRAASASNILSFTVDAKTCLNRVGETSSGTFPLTLTAAGVSLTGGRNTANQIIYIRIP